MESLGAPVLLMWDMPTLISAAEQLYNVCLQETPDSSAQKKSLSYFPVQANSVTETLEKHREKSPVTYWVNKTQFKLSL